MNNSLVVLQLIKSTYLMQVTSGLVAAACIVLMIYSWSQDHTTMMTIQLCLAIMNMVMFGQQQVLRMTLLNMLSVNGTMT
jgi:hypothetical protein